MNSKYSGKFRRSVFSVLMVLVLVLTVLPMGAFAQNTISVGYTLFVNGTDGMFYENNSNGNVVATSGVTGITYDRTSGVLTLEDVSFETTAIVALNVPDGTTIEISGNNEITSGNVTTGWYTSRGITCDGSLTIKQANGRTGTLTVRAGDNSTPAGSSYGIFAGSLILDSGTIAVTAGTVTVGGPSAGGGAESVGIMIMSGGNFTINGGTITVNGETIAFWPVKPTINGSYSYKASNTDPSLSSSAVSGPIDNFNYKYIQLQINSGSSQPGGQSGSQSGSKGSNKGSNSGSSGGSSQTATSTSSNVSSNGSVSNEAIKSEAATALKSTEGTAVALQTKNAVSISSSTLKALASSANKAGKEVVIHADTTAADGSIQGRLYVEPGKLTGLTGDLKLGVYTDPTKTGYTKKYFEKWFDNNIIAVVKCEQQGSFGAKLKIAAKVGLPKDTSKLHFCAYDAKTKKIIGIDTEYFVDKIGYLHFSTGYGGDIIISDGPLNRRV